MHLSFFNFIFSILDTESLQKHKLHIEINSKLFRLY